MALSSSAPSKMGVTRRWCQSMWQLCEDGTIFDRVRSRPLGEALATIAALHVRIVDIIVSGTVESGGDGLMAPVCATVQCG